MRGCVRACACACVCVGVCGACVPGGTSWPLQPWNAGVAALAGHAFQAGHAGLSRWTHRPGHAIGTALAFRTGRPGWAGRADDAAFAVAPVLAADARGTGLAGCSRFAWRALQHR